MLFFPPFSLLKTLILLNTPLSYFVKLLCTLMKTLAHIHKNSHKHMNILALLGHLVHVKTKIEDKWISPLIWCKDQFGPLSFVTIFIF